MQALIWIGAAVTLVGLGLLVHSIRMVSAGKREGLDDDALRARIVTAVMWNLIAVGLSGIGLGMVVVGLLLS